MQMNQTPSSERVHIGFFGRRNAGKSSGNSSKILENPLDTKGVLLYYI